jgi:carbamoyltransferase
VLSLGISCNHDAGVAVVDGNRIVFAANEERYTRKKFDWGFPINALREAIDFCNSTEFDCITFDGRMQTPHPRRANLVFSEKTLVSRLAEVDVLAKLFFGTSAGVKVWRILMRGLTAPSRQFYRSTVSSLKITANIRYAEHHQAHAASSSLLFGGSDGLAVTIDAFGEGICAGIWRLQNGVPQQVRSVPGFHSVGMLYIYVTHLLGFKPGQEGKVTGLAGHGQGETVSAILQRRINYQPRKKRFMNIDLGYGSTAISRLRRDLKGFDKEDIAAGVQRTLEELVLRYIKDALSEHTSSRPSLYLAGGVFANVSLNRRIAEELPVRDVAVAPNMGDGGLALGAALLNHDERVEFRDLYLGSDLATTIQAVPIDLWAHLSEVNSEDLPLSVAKRLAAGQIVAVSRGRMEYGPRALGNRTILAPATASEINDSLNKRLKRTEFMPFAPVVRDIDADKYFYLTQPRWAYENMTVTCAVVEDTRRSVPAIVHVDGTARPQVLEQKRNPFIYEVLSRYQELTGIGVLVNTSFNIHEEPIVRDAATSVRSFLTSNLDALVLENRLFERRVSKAH